MIRIVTDKCKGCKSCVCACPSHAIRIDNKVASISEGCMDCKICLSACKFGAIEDVILQKHEQFDVTEYRGICILGECKENEIPSFVYELIGEGRRLSNQLGEELSVILVGNQLKEAAMDLIGYGVDKVYIAYLENMDFVNETTYVNIFCDFIHTYKPEIVLVGATLLGRTIAPRVAARLNTGLTADCTQLEIDKESRLLLQIRPAMGESLMASIICRNNRPQMATVRPHIFPMPTPIQGNRGVVKTIVSDEHKDEESQIIKILEHVIHKKEKDIIVAGGRGMGNAENFAYLKKLAQLLDAEIGVTRPIVDELWESYEHQIGQTGRVVSPKIYFAFGISGAIQHMMGITSSDIIVAINKDANARIFDIATYGIVGDAVEVAKVLISMLEGTTIERLIEG